MPATSRTIPLSAIFLFLAGFCLPHANAAAKLPQEHAWQVTLRDYIGSLKTNDFDIKDHNFHFPADYNPKDIERIYRDWIVLGHLGREPTSVVFLSESKFFTLDAIEGEEIRIFPEPAALAWWIQFDFPGNPYVGTKAGMRRAVVIAIVDMIMLETAQRADPRNVKPDFMGANLGTWAYTFHHCKEVIPPNVQQAYRDGMLYYLKMMERIAPRDQNTNMDMREIATLAELAHVFDDPAMKKRLVNLARRILFGDPHRGPATSDPRRGTFHPAGYIGEEDGPETSYNGISLFHLAEAAMITRGDPDWDDFMPEVIRRMVRFKAYNTIPEPDGSYQGPSSWAKRTNAPYPNDQRDRPWRPFAEAMLTDEALFRLRVNPSEYDGSAFGFAGRETMLADIAAGINRISRRPKQPEKWKHDQPPVWAEDHWPADIPYTWDHYVPGSYARFKEFVDNKSELLLPPFERKGDFNENFDGEFWMAKRGDWGFQVEAVPHMGRGYDVGGSGALAGGSLATFWTRPTGVVVLGRLPNKWNYVTWDIVDKWPTHHIWGRTAAGPAFSSARQRAPHIRFETDVNPPQVHVFGGLGMDRTVEKPQIISTGHVYYRRRFTMRENGLHVHSELLSNGADQVTELWETIPIFLNATRRSSAPDTKIEFRVNNQWREGSTKLVPGVEAIRATRHDGSVVIEFDKPQRVQLSEVITTAYQQKDRLQNVVIDLLGSDGKAAAMPKTTAVGYLIRQGEARKEG